VAAAEAAVVRKKLSDKEKSKDWAALNRKRKSREKLSDRPPKQEPVSLEDLMLPPGGEEAIEVLLGCRFSDLPVDIERSFLRAVAHHRQMIKDCRAKYLQKRHLPLVYDAKCINAFVVNEITRRRACYCIGKHCPRRDIEK
jgi:hypothetical protein